MMKYKKILGIDIGGSGIKGAPVNTKKGKLIDKRLRVATPDPATPEAVAAVIRQIAEHFKWDGLIGCGFPGVVRNGIVRTAANLDKSWADVDARKLFSEKTGLPVTIVNDADSAGMAEMKFGAGKHQKGAVILITVGTGIGTVFFTKGKLLPNTELGHLIFKGMDAEVYTSDATRKRENLTWDDWAERFNEYLREIYRLFSPDMIIIGGGVSKKGKKFFDHLTVDTRIVAAKLKNEAGIIGAALAARANSSAR